MRTRMPVSHLALTIWQQIVSPEPLPNDVEGGRSVGAFSTRYCARLDHPFADGNKQRVGTAASPRRQLTFLTRFGQMG